MNSLLSQSSFWQINKDLVREIGLESSILLADLIHRESHPKDCSIITIMGEAYVSATSKQLEESTTLSYSKQRKCIKTLINGGYIKTALKGLPAKTFFNIRY
tara:strand:- start:376 stop:681 length:306 start_codon:yes stop_codon:yes gene_type:complete